LWIRDVRLSHFFKIDATGLAIRLACVISLLNRRTPRRLVILHRP